MRAVGVAVGLLASAGDAQAQRVLRNPHTPRTHEVFSTVKSHATSAFSTRHGAPRLAGAGPNRMRMAFGAHRQRFEAQFPRTDSERSR